MKTGSAGGIAGAANDAVAGERPHLREIVSHKGEYYLDAAWPIFGGKAGVLRLGFSESALPPQVNHLWVADRTVITLGILLIAGIGSLFCCAPVTRPLAALSPRPKPLTGARPTFGWPLRGEMKSPRWPRPLTIWSAARRYTQRLKRPPRTSGAPKRQLDMRTAAALLSISREISGLRTLEEMGDITFWAARETLRCGHLALVILDAPRDLLFVLSGPEVRIGSDGGLIRPGRILTA